MDYIFLGCKRSLPYSWNGKSYLDRYYIIRHKCKPRMPSTLKRKHEVTIARLYDHNYERKILQEDGNFLYDWYEITVVYGLDLIDSINPFKADTLAQFNAIKQEITKTICDTNADLRIPDIPNHFRKLSSSEYDKHMNILRFEASMHSVHLTKCPCCLSEKLRNQKSKNNLICSLCLSDKRYEYNKSSSLTHAQQRHQFLLDHEMLPVWYHVDDLILRKNPQYEVPNELSSLTDGEILLIQRYSPLVPVFHMSKGNTGMKGHCVCFIQNNDYVCNELPKKKCNIVKIIKQTEYNGQIQTNHFTINRNRVLNALYWLKDHHKYYKDIEIAPENLEWMNGKDECEMTEEVLNIIENTTEEKISSPNQNVTVSSTQTETEKNDIETFGTCRNFHPPQVNNVDKSIFSELKETLQSEKHPEASYMNFPSIENNAVCEYSEDILPNIFPHLYPGGIGGHNNHHNDNQNIHTYAQRLINYYDGRFATDKIWSYYLLDMIQRNKNNNDGNYVIKNGFLGNVCQTVDDLKERIKVGDLSWIDMLRNFSKRIRGSDNYWRSKRLEVESWINYHIEEGNGPPSLFLTLSCAENWWYDLQRLLKDKLRNSGQSHVIDEMNSDNDSIKMAARSRVSILYSSLVQEFFHIRVSEWIKTVGKKVFGIEHYWARFEFAKGRGQIHLHMLAITKNRSHQKEYYDLMKKGKIFEARESLAKYAREVIGLTAEHPGVSDGTASQHPNVSSFEKKFHIEFFYNDLMKNHS